MANQRRALSSMLPPTSRRGDEVLAAVCFDALDAASRDDADTLTHGFHSYPARLHPSIARVILERTSLDAPALVVDPFCGSGTVLIEARRRGLASTGADINPVALRVARVKSDVRDEASRASFLARLESVVEKSKERVRARAESRAPVSKTIASRFEGHVLRELGGLYAEIEAVDDEADRKALEVVLSAIVVKVSKQTADTAPRDRDDEAVRKIGRFIPTEIFAKKGRELAERWASLAAACPASSPSPTLLLEDARKLDRALKARGDVIITSPPYAGTYDYAKHHELRAPWLGVDDVLADSMRNEIGARRTLAGKNAAERWDGEVHAMLRALAKSLRRGSLAFLVVGDGEIAGTSSQRAYRTRVRAVEHLERCSVDTGVVVVASATAPRPDRRGGEERGEHVVALRRDPSA
jgi:hypothetical protein